MPAAVVWLLTQQVAGDPDAPQRALGVFSSFEAARRAVHQELDLGEAFVLWSDEPWSGERIGLIGAVVWIYKGELIPLVFRVVPFEVDAPPADIGLAVVFPGGASATDGELN